MNLSKLLNFLKVAMGNLALQMNKRRNGGRAADKAGAADSETSASDLSAATSGHYGAQFGYVHEEECPEGIDENLALLLTAAAVAASAFVIFREVTLAQAGRRRRREAEEAGVLFRNSPMIDFVLHGT